MPDNLDSAKLDDKEVKQPLAVQRFEFEKAKNLRDEAREDRRLQAERKARYWNRLALVLPLLTAIIGYFIQSALSHHDDHLRFVDRQLSELYYPIQLRLKKDDAMFEFWDRNQDKKEDNRVIKELRRGSMFKNHEQITSILEQHSNLLLNPDENTNIQPLMESLSLYERHVALLSALQSVGDDRTPEEVDHEFEYPKCFADEINKRVHQLEEQRHAWF